MQTSADSSLALAQETRDPWFTHVAPIACFLIALGAMIVAPVQAVRWYRAPFIGALLEHTGVVSSIGGARWPAREAGVREGDLLVAVDGRPVADADALLAALGAGAGRTVRLGFERYRTRAPFEVAIQTSAFSFYDFTSLFVVPYVVGLIFMGLGVWVYLVRGRTRAGRVFLVLCSAATVANGAFFDLNTSHSLARLWSASLPVAGSALLHLSLVFPRDLSFVRRWSFTRYLAWLPGLPAIIASEVYLYDLADPWAYFAPWRNNYLLAGVSILFLLGLLAWRMRRSTSPTVRQQSRIIVLGATIAFGPLAWFFIPSALGIPVPFYAAVYIPFSLVFPFAVAYSILRYRLPEADRLLNRGVTYSLLASAVVLAYFALMALLSALLGSTVAANDPLLVSLALFALVVLFNPLRDRAQLLVDRLFYRQRADYRQALEAFSHELTGTLSLPVVLDHLMERVAALLTPARVLVFLFDEEARWYLPLGRDDATPDVVFHPDGDLARALRDAPAPLHLAPDSPRPAALAGDWDKIARLALAVCVPLKTEERLSGWLALGPKRSGQPYSDDDLNFLAALAAQSALAVENARLFVNLRRNYQETVEMKNLMDDIFASIASGVITTDVQDKITHFNAAAQRILGLSADGALGQSVDAALPPLGAQLAALVDRVKADDRPTTGHELNTELAGRGALNLRVSLSPLKDAGQATIGVTIVLDDLTEQRRLEADRERIRQTFGRVVAPRVRDKLLSDPSLLNLAGTRQEITILFADVRGFTTLSERLGPDEVFGLLNEYLQLAAQAVLAHEGTIDKFLGDAVMAFFNAPDPQPDHPLRAVRAALDLQAALAAHRRASGVRPVLHMGVGITVGEAVVGNVGTAELFNYTAIGDPVNLARRLQENASRGQILLSRAAYERVRERVGCRALDPILVKGRETLEQVYEVVRLRE
jgi:PAS domain S-box-containing protein